MKITNEVINLEDGSKIDMITLANSNGIEVEILTLGGVIKSIKVPDKEGEFENILMEFKDMNTYIENPGHLNAIIGRTAGRIHNAEITINDQDYKFDKNNGNNTLHGGKEGWDKRNWDFKDASNERESAVELFYFSPDGEEGYPGNVKVKVIYSLDNENIFTIYYEAVSDKDTLINLTNHAYFNLSGDAKRSIKDQELMIKAGHICELDLENIVTGELLDVSKNTPFDFMTPKAIKEGIGEDHSQLNPRNGYDHPWVLDEGQQAATLYDPISGRYLELSTDQKTVVIFTMNGGSSSEFTNNAEDMTHYGITFETQSYPIGHNQCFRDDSLVKANEKYIQKTSFKFGTK